MMKAVKFSWTALAAVSVVAVVVLSSIVRGQVLAADSIRYRATVRDFLPATCMADKDEYYDAYGYNDQVGGNPGTYSTLENQNSGNCEYFSEIQAGLIDGHPDFESAIGSDASRNKAFVARLATGIVKDDLELHKSGLRKVAYCSDNGGRCGCRASGAEVFCHTSNKTYFDVWYRDNDFYNKRHGFGFNLRKLASECVIEDGFEACTYEFSSRNMDEQTGFVPVAADRDDYFGPLDDFVGVVTQTAFPDFRTAPSWPQSSPERSSESGSKFWFTTEIHSYFQYRGDETFTFSGDDDVWVFLNNKLVPAFDLGGVHGAIGDTVDLVDLEAFLGIEKGKIYNFDMFHAERHRSQSNFILTTSLGGTCNVIQSSSVSLKFGADLGTGFEQFAGGDGVVASGVLKPNEVGYVTSRSAAVNQGAGELRLVQAGNQFTSNHIFGATQQNVGTGFVSGFSFTVAETGTPQGFAFVVHQRPEGLEDLPATTGSNLGFKFITNSLAVVFDFETKEVRLHYNDDPNGFNDATVATKKVDDDFIFFRPGETYTVEVHYLQDPDWLEVYIDESLFLRKEDFVVETVLGGGRNAFMGFTSSTAEDSAAITITGWEVRSVDLDTSKSGLVASAAVDAGEPLVLVADNSSLTGILVQTFDFCGNEIEFGGFPELLTAVWVEVFDSGENDTITTYADGGLLPAVIPATVVDNNNGTYTAGLVTTTVAGFDLHLCLGTCSISVDFVDLDVGSTRRSLRRSLQTAGQLQQAEVTIVEGNGAVFTSVVPNALASIDPEDVELELGDFDGADDGIGATATIGLAAGGGGIFTFFLALVAITHRNRKRWRKDKAFIDEGKIYNLDQSVVYDKDNEHSRVGRALMNTMTAINSLRAESNPKSKDTHISTLVDEKRELEEELRTQKQRTQRDTEAKSPTAAFASAMPSTKKQFSFRPDSCENPVYDTDV